MPEAAAGTAILAGVRRRDAADADVGRRSGFGRPRGAFDATSPARNSSGAKALIVPLTCCGYYPS